MTFAELGPAEFRQSIDAFVAVYSAAMNPPERMLTGRDSILDRHAASPGFRALAALVPSRSADGGAEVAGFTYGFHGEHGQWWHDMVSSALALATTGSAGATATEWIDDSFEVAELHVMPAHQGAGVGRSLLLRLLDDRPERTALLSTQDAESKARRLYRGVGFADLLINFRFAGGEPPYAVMGAPLPLRVQIPEAARPDAARSAESPRPSIS
ncbi:MAG: GNAT family N-acetyltransferase [Streptosporangiales bacterium]|nr:GNAT family N-acetyltransferase [Streptosporangiales bacterium]